MSGDRQGDDNSISVPGGKGRSLSFFMAWYARNVALGLAGRRN